MIFEILECKYLEAQGVEVWDVVKIGPFIPTTIINVSIQPKPEEKWNEEDNTKFLLDKKDKKFIAYTLEMHGFFQVSNYNTTKEIWEILEFKNKKDKKSRIIYISC